MTPTATRVRSHAKYPKVTQELRARVVSGRYSLGERLPHRDELEAELGASRATMQLALNTLLRDGFLRSAAGQGTFVSERPPFLSDIGLLFPTALENFGQHRFYAAVQRVAVDRVRARP